MTGQRAAVSEMEAAQPGAPEIGFRRGWTGDCPEEAIPPDLDSPHALEKHEHDEAADPALAERAYREELPPCDRTTLSV
jgi:hypothetical protein